MSQENVEIVRAWPEGTLSVKAKRDRAVLDYLPETHKADYEFPERRGQPVQLTGHGRV